MTVSILDSGALIALERNDRAMWARLVAAARDRDEVLVPSTALAQVWRGTPRQALLAKALRRCAIASFDPLAREVGELCGQTATNDVCDAHVALVAAARGDYLYTSDVSDMERLLAALGGKAPRVIAC